MECRDLDGKNIPYIQSSKSKEILNVKDDDFTLNPIRIDLLGVGKINKTN
ncbi:MAG: hypothetical protein ABJB76_11245 [Candidatus Nitrosocosmicus sp.]